MTSAVARGQWKLARRARLRKAMDALGAARPDEALRELAHEGAAEDEQAAAIFATAFLMMSPTPPNAERCVAALEKLSESPGPGIFAVASAALPAALGVTPDHHPGDIRNAARLANRFMRLVGQSLPWGQYNLAVDALVSGDLRTAAGHLAAGASPPERGWPVAPLGAACAAVLGEAASLSQWLADPSAAPGFAADFRLLTAISEVFGCLAEDRPFPDRAVRLLGGPPGPLSRVVPQLGPLRILLADLSGGNPPRVSPDDLAGCAWGQWLCGRLTHASGEIVEILTEGGAVDGGAPVLAWERLGSRQDIIELLSGERAREVRQRLASLARLPGPHAAVSLWTGLASLRQGLADGDAADRGDPVPCPWQTEDQVLRKLASHDGETERGYLQGRRTLRAGDLPAARRCFAATRARVSAGGLAARVGAFRFGPLLDYWEGVTLAHLGRSSDASDLLRACLGGVKGREAQAQLGLLAVAEEDCAEAMRLAKGIPEPRPAAADYLEALAADREGDQAETARLLRRLADRQGPAGIYHQAGHRLRGRCHEAAGEFAAASWQYRQALTLRPGDTLALARLARAWLRQRYGNQGLPPDPLLEGRWPELARVEGTASLRMVHDCLEPDLHRSLEMLVDDPADSALRLLALHAAITVGAADDASLTARAWATAPAPDPRLIRVSLTAEASRLMRDHCLQGGQGPARSRLTGLEAELRAASPDPAIAFWADAARLLLNPESAAAGSVGGAAASAASAGEGAWPAPLRLFAGVLSVFSADPERRRLAAADCLGVLAVLGGDPSVDESARATARCLAAATLSDDGAFLEAYREIENRGLVLPCGLAEGYLALTKARLRHGDLDAVINSPAPEPLADLAHPGLRQMMGTAYARRAARAAETDPRAALNDIVQARELLREPT